MRILSAECTYTCNILRHTLEFGSRSSNSGKYGCYLRREELSSGAVHDVLLLQRTRKLPEF